MPLRPFMGKLMSVITDTAGSLWMLATAGKQKQKKYRLLELFEHGILDEDLHITMQTVQHCYDSKLNKRTTIKVQNCVPTYL